MAGWSRGGTDEGHHTESTDTQGYVQVSATSIQIVSQSMCDNLYWSDADGGCGDAEDAAVASQTAMAEMRDFAGDNFARISGATLGLAKTQLFAWDAQKKPDLSRAVLMGHNVESHGLDMKVRKRQAVHAMMTIVMLWLGTITFLLYLALCMIFRTQHKISFLLLAL